MSKLRQITEVMFKKQIKKQNHCYYILIPKDYLNVGLLDVDKMYEVKLKQVEKK